MKARRVKRKDFSKCRFKCSENITEDERQKIFSTYWSMGDTKVKGNSFVSMLPIKIQRRYLNREKKTKNDFEFVFLHSWWQNG
jgi:Ca2+-binding EF-hand superfamily protein